MGVLFSHPIKTLIAGNAALLYTSGGLRLQQFGSTAPLSVLGRTVGEVLRAWLDKDFFAAAHFFLAMRILIRRCAFDKNFKPFGGAPGQMPKSLLGGGRRKKELTLNPALSTIKHSNNGMLTFPFNVKGQVGEIPRIGFGTATLNLGANTHQTCVNAVRNAIRAGYRHIDTALLYDNQEAVGEGIAAAIASGDVKREDLWVTSKVGFYPSKGDGENCWVPIAYHKENVKGSPQTTAAVDLCLKKLGLDYVDLMLIHCPCAGLDDFRASSSPHLFELSGNVPAPYSEKERGLILDSRLDEVKYDEAASEAARAETWKALEKAQKAGKCKYIGVSNYPPALLRAMEKYATVMPACNQGEVHPRYSVPALRAMAKETGIVLAGYGSGNSCRIEQSAVIKAIADRLGKSPTVVVLAWTLQKGVVVMPRTANPDHIQENLTSTDVVLSDADLAAIDGLNEAHPYYWSPLPLLEPSERVLDLWEK